MKKFRSHLTESEKTELSRLSRLNFSTYTEADVREEFLVELLKLLGYRKGLDYSVSREESFRLNPLFLSVGSNRIKLDYLCSLRKQYFWIIDAKEGRCKDPNNPPQIDERSIAQTHFYSLHHEINCPYFIVSNGWYTNLYSRNDLDDNLTPLLSIRNTEMAHLFLELDGYVGATQLLPKVKEGLLDQIKKVFAAEIRVERLDEFVDAVHDKASKARSQVEKAAVEAYQKNAEQNEPFKALETEDISLSVYSVFQNLRKRFELDRVAGILSRRIIANHHDFQFKEYFFFSRLMLEQPYPVNFWYYPSVLHFLFRANREGITTVYYGQRTIQDMLTEWIDLCLFHLSKRKVLRYLWACEVLYAKIIKQSVLLFPTIRKGISDLLDKGLFYLPEEKLTLFGPNQASIMISVIESSIAYFRSRFIKTYSDEYGYRFKEALAHQEYQILQILSNKIDADFGDTYQKIKKELGDEWRDLSWYEYPKFDRMGSAICDILIWNEHSLHLLTDTQKERIKLLAELDCTNFADDLCGLLGIAYRKDIPQHAKKQAIKDFYDPAKDQYEFKT